jgi:nucleoside 2-deoxyribosyltransferase
MTQKFVYLAGPILGCTKGEANDWRRYVDKQFRAQSPGIVGISPLRCEPLIGERYNTDYLDPRFGTSEAIAAKNMHDVQNCDIVLAYMPKEMGPNISLGTVCEIAWARAWDKQIILVTDHPKILAHPVINACRNWRLDTLDEAVEVCIGVFGGYVDGKNV